ncbi:hypothetical protein [Alkaliphilus peptidifermentans]|uniref:Uncharacterized protein n=1 Tax=Alkaliphilus peptidifermentans DSM 18978 TaxID=1120976 RepID=A0A1G5JJ86_9FIRM|nr:hypothetical protein [Alkaliphilus peptidifermentans]SCY88442.1 hypothetical protein SAMN03080606_02874 [Alkaliphilus peptidifermentans DSM 18978]
MYLVVNKSGSQIPVYRDNGKNERIGTIFNNEYYTITDSNPWYGTATGIMFRNSSGNFVGGLIVHWGWGDDPPTNQDPIHLHPITTATIGGVTHRVLNVRRDTNYRNPNGTIHSRVIRAGERVAIRNNTTGQTHKDHLLFYYLWDANLGVWQTPTSQGYGFVNMGFNGSPGGSSVSTASVYGS